MCGHWEIVLGVETCLGSIILNETIRNQIFKLGTYLFDE